MTTDEESVDSLMEIKEGFIKGEDGVWYFIDRREIPAPKTYGSNYGSEPNVGEETG